MGKKGRCRGLFFLIVGSMFFGACVFLHAKTQLTQTTSAVLGQSVASSGAQNPAEMDAKTKKRVIEKAKDFADLKEIDNVTYPRVVSNHTRFANVLGVDKEGFRMVVGIDPASFEVVKMVTLCPRKIKDATALLIDQREAEIKCREFLKNMKIILPKGYVLEPARQISVSQWKRWRFVWRHEENEVKIGPDFVLVEVNAGKEGNIVFYSKVHHDLMVSTERKITSAQAIDTAKQIMREQVKDLEVLKTDLAVVYPNHFFNKQTWEWSEAQALCWIVQFGRNGEPVMDVWIDARTGKLQGGETYEQPIPELIGIPDQQGDVTGIWQPALNLMHYNTAHTWTADVPEATVTNSISTGAYFILQTHGYADGASQYAVINHSGAADADRLTPDEIPANGLRYALVSCCHSGDDIPGANNDFKEVFIAQGADVFQGYSPSINPDPYEQALVRYLAQGEYLENAHDLAVADTSPWFTIVITYNYPPVCPNMIRLAPLLTGVSRAPLDDIGKEKPFTVSAKVTNGEDAHHTAATNVTARLVLPTGFSIVTGANPQNIGTINWNASSTAAWIIKAPVSTGLYGLDVEVWSDNLGAEVDDFNNPYHQFNVNVTKGGGGCMDWWPW
jgi:hypothetical protein